LPGFDEEMLEIEKNGFRAVLVDERCCYTSLTTTTSTANPDVCEKRSSQRHLFRIPSPALISSLPVYIVFYLLGHVIVDDMLDIRKVEAFRRHVCGHKNVLFAFPE